MGVAHQGRGLVGALPTCYKKAGARARLRVWWYKAGMDVSGGNHRHEAPWKRMSKEVGESQGERLGLRSVAQTLHES